MPASTSTRVLVVTTYELGHQPLDAGRAAAALLARGHEVRVLDLSVEDLDPAAVAWADGVAFAVPMHTATRLARRAAATIRADRAGLPVCFFGLYAPMAGDLGTTVAGEFETGVVAWAGQLGRANPNPNGSTVALGRESTSVPARQLLAPLARYARLVVDGEERLAGYVEASHGCAHRCRHCPVPVVYDGRTRIVAVDTVLADVEQLVAAGARHITFGDPDFLNRPQHAARVVAAVHTAWPDLTVDATVKVEHVLRYADIWPVMAAAGCLFVVSAFESVNDAILTRLDKGHTAADAATATRMLRSHGIEPRPTWLPFTPWGTAADVRDIVEFVDTNDLVGNVDPVQYTIRLLLPEGSLLLSDHDIDIGGFDAELLGYPWAAPDPAVDRLHGRLAALVEEATAAGLDHAELFDAVAVAVGATVRPAALRSPRAVPRLTESWFCCAEPTAAQFADARERR